MPADLLDQLQRILPLATTVADNVVCEEAEQLEEVSKKMFEVMHNVARLSCEYVRHRRSLSPGLIPAARKPSGREIEALGSELAKVIGDFERTVNVEALRKTKETGKYLLSISIQR